MRIPINPKSLAAGCAGLALAGLIAFQPAYAAEPQEGDTADPSEMVNVIVQLDAVEEDDAPGGLFGLFAQDDSVDDPESRHAELQMRARLAALSAYALEQQGSASAHSQGKLLAQAQSAADGIAVVRDYYNAFDGFAMSVPRCAVDDIAALDGVAAAFEEHVYDAPADMGADGGKGAADNASALAMTGADAVVADGYAGDGQVIAVIDTGVYVQHEAFAGDVPDAGKRWDEESIAQAKAQLTQGGRDALYVNEKIPFAWNYGDNDGDLRGYNEHGTHVAGIACANAGEMKGTAPNAQLLAMRVARSYDGGMGDTAILAALDDCVVLRPDVINMSLGTDGGFFDGATNIYSEAFGKLESGGTTLCISAGNAYYSTYRQAGVENHPLATDPDAGTIATPSAHAESFSVASAENAASLAFFTASDGTAVPYRQAVDADGRQGAKFADLANGAYSYLDAGAADEEAIASLKAEAGQGGDAFAKIVIVMDNGARGDLSFAERLASVTALKPAAIIVYDVSGEVPDDAVANIVVGEAGAGQGDSSLSLSAAGAAVAAQAVLALSECVVVGVKRCDAESMLALTDRVITVAQGQVMPAEGGYRMSDFSSWGVTPEMKLKPEITGPGGNIYSTVYDDRYDYMSGTSMSSPALAGLCALVNQYVHADAKFAGLDERAKHDRVYQLVMSTAKPIADMRVDGSYYSPRQQGAGLVNVKAAVETPVYLTVESAQDPARPKAELGSSAQGSWSFTVTLHNVGDERAVFSPDTAALSEQIKDRRFQMRSFNYAGRGIDVSYSGDAYDAASNTVSVDAGSETSYTVTIACGEGFKDAVADAVNGTFVDGFAMLEAKWAGGQDLSVPFVGFFGDWGDVPVFDERAGSGFPAHMYATQLYAMNGSSNGPLGANPFSVYTATGDIDLTRAVMSRSNVKGCYISQDVTAAPSSVVPHTGLLRSPSLMEYVYRNAAGDEVARFAYPFVQKSLHVRYLYPEAEKSPLFTGYDAQGNPLPDGAYTLEERATVAGSGAVQTQSFDFFLDTAAPEVSDVRISGEGDGRKVEFEVADATYLAAVDFTDDTYGSGEDESGRGYYYRIDASKLDPDGVDASGRNVYRFSIPRSELQEAYNDAGHGGDLPADLAICAWDFGLNGSAYGSSSAGDFVIEDGVLKSYDGNSTNVDVPEGVSSIAEGAFAYSRVKQVKLPASVRSIGARAFYQSMGLTSLVIADSSESPSRLRDIGAEAFAQTGLAKVYLPDTVRSVGARAFSQTPLQVADFGRLARIDETTFASANPKRVVMRGARSYCASMESSGELRPMEAAVFAEGLEKAEFKWYDAKAKATYGIVPPATIVIPSTCAKLELVADQEALAVSDSGRTLLARYDPGSVVIYAPKDTLGWETAKAALESIGANPDNQLKSVSDLDDAWVEELGASGVASASRGVEAHVAEQARKAEEERAAEEARRAAAAAQAAERAAIAKATPGKASLVKKKTKSRKRGKVTVAWKKIAGASGYQLKVGKKAYTVKGAAKLKKTVKAKRGKKVKVQVRAFALYKGKTLYGPWSAAKKVKVKK